MVAAVCIFLVCECGSDDEWVTADGYILRGWPVDGVMTASYDDMRSGEGPSRLAVRMYMVLLIFPKPCVMFAG
jgi:hypothetical protein